jgi:hypothetical protein
MDLPQRERDVLDVLQDLNRNGCVELAIGDRQRGRLPFAHLDHRGASSDHRTRQIEHLGAPVDADDVTVGRDMSGEVGGEYRGTATHIEDPLTGMRRQRVDRHTASTHHIRRLVHPQDLSGPLLVEQRRLRHRDTSSCSTVGQVCPRCIRTDTEGYVIGRSP